MLHLAAGVLDIQSKLHHHNFFSHVVETCSEQLAGALRRAPCGSEEDESTAAESGSEREPSPTPCDVEEVVAVAGKTQIS